MEDIGVKLVAQDAPEFFRTLQQAQQAMQATGQEAASAGRGFDVLDAATKRALKIDSLTDKLSLQQRQLGLLQTELSQTAAKYGEASSQAQKKALALDRLQSQINGTERELAALKTASAQAGAGLTSASRDADAAGKSFGTLGERAEKGFSALREVATGALRQVGEGLAGLAADGLRALGSFAVGSVSAAGDFEAGMNTFKVAAGDALGAAGLELGEFEALFIDIGRRLPVSTAAVQEAATTLVRGGIDPLILKMGGLESSIQFAAAAGMDLNSAAELSIKQLGTFVPATASAAEQTEFLARSQELLVKVAGASTLDVDKLGDAMLAAGGQARAAGVEYGDFATTMGLISPSFGSAAEAGTSYKNFLARLQPTTKSAASAMAELNLLTADGKSKFYDSTGAFVGNRQAAELLKQSVTGLSDAQRVSTLQAIFGNDAMGAATALAAGGAEAYDIFAQKVALASGVTETAAGRQQGFNVAVDNMMGSLEALQISLGTLVLPMLTTFINEGLAPAVNSLTTFVQGLNDSNTGLGTFAAFIGEVAVPAFTGLVTALIAYATAQVVQATPAILASIPALQAQATQVLANTAAWAAAAAPYVILAATVGAVVYKYQELGQQAQERLAELQETRPALQAATQAEQAYAGASEATRKGLEPYNASLSVLKTQYGAAVEELTRLEAYGYRTTAQQAAQKDVIAQLEGQIGVLSGAMQTEAQRLNEVEAASLTATNKTQELANAHPELQQQISRTEADLAKLAKALDETYKKGGEAVGAFVQTETEFLSEAEQRRSEYNSKIQKLQEQLGQATTAEQRKAIQEQIAEAERGYQEQETAAAASYSQQQAAQRAHLGVMLQEYIVSQAQLGNVGKEEAAQLVEKIGEEYGVMEDNNAATFLRMTSAIDDWAANAKSRQEESAGSAESAQARTSSSIDTLIGDLNEQEQAAVETKQKMDEYSTEYVATAVANFTEKQGEAEDYAQSLRDIPREVTVRIRVQADPVPEDLRRRSPSPLEQAVANVNALALQASAEGLPAMTRSLDVMAIAADGALMGLHRGLEDPNVVETATATAEGIESAFRDTLDVHSESELFKDIGIDVLNSLISGLEYATPLIEESIGKISGDIVDQFTTMAEEVRDLGAELAENMLGGKASMSRQMVSNRKFVRDLDDEIKDLEKRRKEIDIAVYDTPEHRQRDLTEVQGKIDRARQVRDRSKDLVTEAQAEADALFAKTGDKAAAAELFAFRSKQIQEIMPLRLAAELERTPAAFQEFAEVQQAQRDELAAFMADIQGRAGETQQRIGNLRSSGENIQSALQNRIDFESQVAQTGYDDEGKRYGNKQRESYLVSSARGSNLLTALTPFLQFIEQVASGEAPTTLPDFSSLQQVNLDPFGQYGGQVGWVGGHPYIAPHQATTVGGVTYIGRTPEWWPDQLVGVPSDVQIGNPIPDKWEREWAINPVTGTPIYIGAKPPTLPGGLPPPPPQFGYRYFKRSDGQWIQQNLPQYRVGGTMQHEGLARVHQDELLAYLPRGMQIIPAAAPPSIAARQSSYSDQRTFNFQPQYSGGPPAQQMDYHLMMLWSA